MEWEKLQLNDPATELHQKPWRKYKNLRKLKEAESEFLKRALHTLSWHLLVGLHLDREIGERHPKQENGEDSLQCPMFQIFNWSEEMTPQ